MMLSAPEQVRILLVGHDGGVADHMRASLAPRFVCEVASNPESALLALGASSFDMVVANDAEGTSALELLDTVHEQNPSTPFIVVGDLEVARAMAAGKRGAYDYVVRSSDHGALVGCLDRASSELARSTGRTSDGPHGGGAGGVSSGIDPVVVGSSPSFLAMLDAIDRVAQSSAPVLLVGESGTGKNLLAERIHARGPRRHRPFVVVDVAALAPARLESELFGHGADGSGVPSRRGLITEAEGGTLVLNQILGLPPELQGRLLRVIETGLLRPVGATHERLVNVRFVATTHDDLALAVREHLFREDLFYRLNALAIGLPPLRERSSDVPGLVEYFFARARTRNPRSPVEQLAPGVRAQLTDAAWPGNVRELAGLLERLVVLGKNPVVDVSDLSALVRAVLPRSVQADAPLESLRTMSTRHVESVLGFTKGDKPRAAAILGIDVSTLYRWRRQRSEG